MSNVEEFCSCSLGFDLTSEEMKVNELTCLIALYMESCSEGRPNLAGAIEDILGQPFDSSRFYDDFDEARGGDYNTLFNIRYDYEWRMEEGDVLEPRELLELSAVILAEAEQIGDFIYKIHHEGLDIEGL